MENNNRVKKILAYAPMCPEKSCILLLCINDIAAHCTEVAKGVKKYAFHFLNNSKDT